MSVLKRVAVSVVIGALAFTAAAQPGGGGAGGGGGGGGQPGGRQPGGPGGGAGRQGMQPMDPEKAKAAWDLEATTVAKRVGVDAKKTPDLVKAYNEARTSYQAAQKKFNEEIMKKIGEGDGDRRAMAEETRKANEEMNKAEKAKFEKAISGVVTTEQSGKIMATLGNLSPNHNQWDRIVDVVAGFKLDAAKQDTVLNAVEDYGAAQVKARSGGPDADREAMRTAMQDSRKKLTDTVKPVLSEDQMKKFEESLGGMGGGQRRPGGRGGEGGDGEKPAGGGEAPKKGGDGTPPKKGGG